MLKTIIFDLGKVIVPFDFKRGYTAMEPLCAYPAAEIPSRLGTTDLVPRFESGKVEPEDFVRELSGILDLKVDYPGFCDLWSCIFLPETLIPESMIEGLKKRYRLVLLSNTNAIHFKALEERYPILGLFDAHVLSFRVGAVKPERLIFEKAVEQAQCKAEECFFTDDIPEYVEAARRFGMDAVQFQSREQLEREFTARGVKWD